MTIPNTPEEFISESHLRALYALLPGVLRENLYGTRFSKQLQTWRETLHPRGKIDIQRLGEFDGLTVQVNLGDRLGCDIYYGFVQESWDYSLFMAILKPGDVVLDIGSNFGMYALGAAKRLVPSGRVIAFEPDARSMSLLKENIRLNQFENIVTCLDVCIGSYDGEVDFYAAADPSFSGIYDTNRSETTGHLNLPIRRLDSVMRELGINQINQIKIDVEGAEYDVLEGALEILANSDAIVMLEISSKNLDADRANKLSATLKRLEDQGYVSFVINHKTIPTKLISDESLMDIVRSTSNGQTRNYFLVKRSGEQFNSIQDVFKRLNQDSLRIQENTYLNPLPYSKKNTDVEVQTPLLLQAGIGELDNLQASLWAERIEKLIAINFSRKLLIHNHVLESKFTEINKELAAQTKDAAAVKSKLIEISKELERQMKNVADVKAELAETSKELEKQMEDAAAVKAKLAETNKELEKQMEGAAVVKVKLAETSKELEKQMEDAAAVKAELAESKEKLATREGEKAAFKAKLAETSKKLADAKDELFTLNSGFLGLLFRVKRRLLNRRTLHG